MSQNVSNILVPTHDIIQDFFLKLNARDGVGKETTSGLFCLSQLWKRN